MTQSASAQQVPFEVVTALCNEHEITDPAFIEALTRSELDEDMMEYLLEKASELIDSRKDVVPCWLLLEVNELAHDEIHLEAIFAKARVFKGRSMSPILALQNAIRHCSHTKAELDI